MLSRLSLVLVVMAVMQSWTGSARSTHKNTEDQEINNGDIFMNAEALDAFLFDWSETNNISKSIALKGDGYNGSDIRQTMDTAIEEVAEANDRSDEAVERIDRSDHVRTELVARGVLLPVHHLDTLEEVHHREHHRDPADPEDPFVLRPTDLKFNALLAADVYFSFLTRVVLYFVMISLLLPAIIPLFSLLVLAIEAVVDQLIH
jgi:hypothetical protein